MQDLRGVFTCRGRPARPERRCPTPVRVRKASWQRALPRKGRQLSSGRPYRKTKGDGWNGKSPDISTRYYYTKHFSERIPAKIDGWIRSV